MMTWGQSHPDIMVRIQGSQSEPQFPHLSLRATAPVSQELEKMLRGLRRGHVAPGG